MTRHYIIDDVRYLCNKFKRDSKVCCGRTQYVDKAIPVTHSDCIVGRERLFEWNLSRLENGRIQQRAVAGKVRHKHIQ